MSFKVGDKVRIKKMPAGTVSDGRGPYGKESYQFWERLAAAGYEYEITKLDAISPHYEATDMLPYTNSKGVSDASGRRCPVEWLELVTTAAPSHVVNAGVAKVGDKLHTFVGHSSGAPQDQPFLDAKAAREKLTAIPVAHLFYYPGYEIVVSDKDVIWVDKGYFAIRQWPNLIAPLTDAQFTSAGGTVVATGPLPTGAQFLGYCAGCGGVRKHRLGCRGPRILA